MDDKYIDYTQEDYEAEEIKEELRRLVFTAINISIQEKHVFPLYAVTDVCYYQYHENTQN
jgi:hypothetical protein